MGLPDRLYGISAFLLLLSGCSEGGSVVQTVGLNDSKAVMRKALKVCFVAPTQALSSQAWFEGQGFEKLTPSSEKFFHPEDLKLIKKIVDDEFTVESTVLTFTGFQMCEEGDPSVKNADVYVFRSASRADAPPAVAAAKPLDLLNDTAAINKYFAAQKIYDTYDQNTAISADKSKGIPVQMYLGIEAFCNASYVPTKVLDDCVKMNTLHEFGHIAGLGHAHNHPKAVNDPACKKEDGALILGTGVMRASDSIESEYTPNSVMNYCHSDLYKKGDAKSAIKSLKLLPQEQAFIRKRTLQNIR